nr:unnamed protein product [Callosobruchus analis]
MWRTVDCRRRFPALCELYPDRSSDKPGLTDVDCGGIKDNGSIVVLLPAALRLTQDKSL